MRRGSDQDVAGLLGCESVDRVVAQSQPIAAGRDGTGAFDLGATSDPART